jgi:signal peptidase I
MSNRESLWIEVLTEEWAGPVRLQIQGQSMWPTLRPGDQVTVEPLAADDLRPGDWVVLRRADALILHRFLAFSPEGLLLTKGDNRRFPDPLWAREDLVGRVVTLSRGEGSATIPSSTARWAWTTFYRLQSYVWMFLRRVKRAILLLTIV